jgi:hypothetical protein
LIHLPPESPVEKETNARKHCEATVGFGLDLARMATPASRAFIFLSCLDTIPGCVNALFGRAHELQANGWETENMYGFVNVHMNQLIGRPALRFFPGTDVFIPGINHFDAKQASSVEITEAVLAWLKDRTETLGHAFSLVELVDSDHGLVNLFSVGRDYLDVSAMLVFIMHIIVNGYADILAIVLDCCYSGEYGAVLYACLFLLGYAGRVLIRTATTPANPPTTSAVTTEPSMGAQMEAMEILEPLLKETGALHVLGVEANDLSHTFRRLTRDYGIASTKLDSRRFIERIEESEQTGQRDLRKGQLAFGRVERDFAARQLLEQVRRARGSLSLEATISQVEDRLADARIVLNLPPAPRATSVTTWTLGASATVAVKNAFCGTMLMYETVLLDQTQVVGQSIVKYMQNARGMSLHADRAQHAFANRAMSARSMADLYGLRGVRVFKFSISGGRLCGLTGVPLAAGVVQVTPPPSPTSAASRASLSKAPHVVLNRLARRCGTDLRVTDQLDNLPEFPTSTSEAMEAAEVLRAHGLSSGMIRAVPFIVANLRAAGVDEFRRVTERLSVSSSDEQEEEEAEPNVELEPDVGFAGLDEAIAEVSPGG